MTSLLTNINTEVDFRSFLPSIHVFGTESEEEEKKLKKKQNTWAEEIVF